MAKVLTKIENIFLNLNKEISREDLYIPNMVDQRSEGKPMAYFMNKKSFGNTNFL